MYVAKGSPQDAREIAKLYCAAFPESVELFFGTKPFDKLLNLLELTFLLVFYSGGEALLVKNEAGSIYGYCLYRSAREASANRSLRKMLTVLPKMASKTSLAEIGKLLHNQLIMATSTKRTKKRARPQAQIISIAISPTCQGQGVGTLLFRSVLNDLEPYSVGLNVRADNPAARRLYAKTGFQECGTTSDLSGKWIMLVK